MESVRVGQGADLITHLLVEITGDLAHDRRRALRLQGTGRAVVLAGPVVDDVTLVDVAGTGQLCAAWTDIDVALQRHFRTLRDHFGFMSVHPTGNPKRRSS